MNSEGALVSDPTEEKDKIEYLPATPPPEPLGARRRQPATRASFFYSLPCEKASQGPI
jgi:hypothetical protein